MDLERTWMHAEERIPELAGIRPFKTYALLAVYERLFAAIGPVATILELGIDRGGSLVLWREALAADRVVGVDHNVEPPPAVALALGSYLSQLQDPKAIVCHWDTDQSDESRLGQIVDDDLGGKVDLVIDDASHRYAPTIASFLALWPVLRPGGHYVIEDWNTDVLPGFPSPGATMARLVSELVGHMSAETLDIAELAIYPPCVVLKKMRPADVPDRERYMCSDGRTLPERLVLNRLRPRPGTEQPRADHSLGVDAAARQLAVLELESAYRRATADLAAKDAHIAELGGHIARAGDHIAELGERLHESLQHPWAPLKRAVAVRIPPLAALWRAARRLRHRDGL